MASLMQGPPGFVSLSAGQLTRFINRLQGSLGNHSNAWRLLGYCDPSNQTVTVPKPTQDTFEQEIDALWEFSVQNDDSLAGRTARARILEALKSLGYYRRVWYVNTPQLELHDAAAPATHASYDGVLPYGQLKDPSPTRPSLPETAAEALNRPPNEVTGTSQQWSDVRFEQDRLWKQYHAYQGLVSKDGRGVRHRFRAIPVPRSNSLWHSIA